MLTIPHIANYWKDSAVPTSVMQAAAPEFAPVFPPLAAQLNEMVL